MTSEESLADRMSLGNSPKGCKRPRSEDSPTSVMNEMRKAINEGGDISTEVLYRVVMNKNGKLEEICGMFQYLFSENALLKNDLMELKESYKGIVNELKQLTDNVAMTTNEKNLDIGLHKVSGKIANAPKNTKKTSYAAVTKHNSSVIVIKPKNASQTSAMTKAKLRKEIDPANFPISNIRHSNDGSIVIQCANKPETAALLKDAEAKLGDSYDVKAKTGRCPKVKIIGMADEMIDDVLLDSMIKQNHDVFINCGKPKIVQRFKTKNSYGIKLEVEGNLFKNLMEAGRVTIGWDTCVLSMKRSTSYAVLNVAAIITSPEHVKRTDFAPNVAKPTRTSVNRR